jgi:putative restriction endonuclease
MLLAVLGLAAAGNLTRNVIEFAPPLLERYARIFGTVRTERDHPNPYFPFFHLQRDRFWHLRPAAGKEAILAAMDSARSFADITDNVQHAYLDDELHALMLDERARKELRDQLVVTWFGSQSDALSKVLREEQRIDRYETELRGLASGTTSLLAKEPPPPARDAAFRRVVSQIYDYRCAASGWRIILPDSRSMIEAAHLIPFSESHDDDPRNGIALVPSFHWALDANVIAPGPDYKWHVSRVLDERLSDNRPLLELGGKTILLPKDKGLWPKEEALQWRMQHLIGRPSA